jgi:hypothetical protein
VGWLGVCAQQGALADHQLDLDVGGGCGLSGESLVEGVGHELRDRAGVALGTKRLGVFA